MKVTAVLSSALEVEGREPVVVLPRCLSMHERAYNREVAVFVAHVPKRRKERVDVQLRRAPPVIEETVEAFGIFLTGDAISSLRWIAQTPRLLDEKRGEQPKTVVALPLLVGNDPGLRKWAHGRRPIGHRIRPNSRSHVGRDEKRIARGGKVRLRPRLRRGIFRVVGFGLIAGRGPLAGARLLSVRIRHEGHVHNREESTE
jgi:hypothetical protein